MEGVPVGAGIAQRHSLEAHLAAGLLGVEGDRVLRVGDGRGEVEVLEDAAEQRLARRELDADVEHPHEGAEEPGLQPGERHERADRHALPGRGQTGGEIDERRDGGEDDRHRPHAPPARHLGLQLELGQRLGGPREPLRQSGTRAHRLGEHDPVDGQGLLDLGLHVRERALGAGLDAAAQAGDPAAQPDGGRQDDQADQ